MNDQLRVKRKGATELTCGFYDLHVFFFTRTISSTRCNRAKNAKRQSCWLKKLRSLLTLVTKRKLLPFSFKAYVGETS